AREREPDLEPERTEGGEPADSGADAVEQPQRQGAVSVGVRSLVALEEVLGLREGVARVVEEDPAHTRRFDDGELELPVGDELLVAPDGEVDLAGVRLAGGGDLRRRGGAAQRVAADGIAAAREELLADGDGLVHRIGRADVAERGVELEDEAERQRVVAALDEAVALEEVLAAEERGRELGR